MKRHYYEILVQEDQGDDTYKIKGYVSIPEGVSDDIIKKIISVDFVNKVYRKTGYDVPHAADAIIEIDDKKYRVAFGKYMHSSFSEPDIREMQ